MPKTKHTVLLNGVITPCIIVEYMGYNPDSAGYVARIDVKGERFTAVRSKRNVPWRPWTPTNRVDPYLIHSLVDQIADKKLPKIRMCEECGVTPVEVNGLCFGCAETYTEEMPPKS